MKENLRKLIGISYWRCNNQDYVATISRESILMLRLYKSVRIIISNITTGGTYSRTVAIDYKDSELTGEDLKEAFHVSYEAEHKKKSSMFPEQEPKVKILYV